MQHVGAKGATVWITKARQCASEGVMGVITKFFSGTPITNSSTIATSVALGQMHTPWTRTTLGDRSCMIRVIEQALEMRNRPSKVEDLGRATLDTHNVGTKAATLMGTFE